MQFSAAVRLVPGLEFLGTEDLEPDDLDDSPVLYLMVPSEAALRNIVTLWRGWQRNGTVPPNYSAWKAMLSQLRNIRPWGPQDRVTPADFDFGSRMMLVAQLVGRQALPDSVATATDLNNWLDRYMSDLMAAEASGQ